MSARLVLFDVDHTLVDVLAFHEPVYAEVLSAIFGVPATLRDITFSGKTTPNIIRELALGAGVPHATVEKQLPAALDRFNAAVVARLPADLRSCVLPGISELLTCLSIHGSVLGVVTGNPPAIGQAVLGRAGLLKHFATSTFGTEARERHELIAIAVRKCASELGMTLHPRDVVVVGDSPHDVLAGRLFGARTLALATGLSSEQELRAARPDFLFADARAHEAICRAIHTSAERPVLRWLLERIAR